MGPVGFHTRDGAGGSLGERDEEYAHNEAGEREEKHNRKAQRATLPPLPSEWKSAAGIPPGVEKPVLALLI